MNGLRLNFFGKQTLMSVRFETTNISFFFVGRIRWIFLFSHCLEKYCDIRFLIFVFFGSVRSLEFEDFRMNLVKITVVVLILISTLVTAAESSHEASWPRDEDKNRTARQTSCKENLEYVEGNHCCQNCEAGTYVKTPCSTNLEKGTCEPCESNTFTEHSNGMKQCLPCTRCRPDEEELEKCTSIQDAKCQCSKGSFCLVDEACEACNKCHKCKPNEELVKNCTTTSNTVCKKREGLPPATPPTTSKTPLYSDSAILLVILVAVVVVLGIVGFTFWRRPCQNKTEIQSNPSEVVKIPMGSTDDKTLEERENHQNIVREAQQPEAQPLLQETRVVAKPLPFIEDEDNGLGDSLPNTTSSSQTSLSALPTLPASNGSPQHSPEIQRLPDSKNEYQHRLLIPKNGEESLKKSFDLFDEFMNVKKHNKFFRFIGLTDNVIKNAENTHPEDKVYELLKAWMQREGLKANINILIDALFRLDQKYSAEKIISMAIDKGYYKYDEEGY